MEAATAPSADQILERARTDYPWYARNLLKIVDKRSKLVPFIHNDAQIALEGKLREQREAGKPERVISLKARQVGISTDTQGRLIHRSTTRAYRNALVVAHDVETGGKLFAIGQRMYSNLPNDIPELKPPIHARRRTRFLHFGQRGEVFDQPLYPDSTYWVDTAGEFESGRGGTYHDLHGSEVGFWPQAEQKYIALMQAIPDEPDTFVNLESTANGLNFFKDIWDDAEAGRSEFVAFFWPWWRQTEYSRPFLNEADKAEFRVGDMDQSPYAEEESELLDPGPIDTLTGLHVPLTLEQLNWRRWAIANKCGGKINKFHQEYPATPEQAFLSSGRKVFEPTLVALAMKRAKVTDPLVGPSGPIRGRVEATERKMVAGRVGKIERPGEPIFKPARMLLPGEAADWRIWLPAEKTGHPIIPEEGRYVIGNDVSGGISEAEDHEGEPAFHAIEVIDHRTLVQVAEYRSRVDPAVLTEHVYLTALLFNNAELAVEITGGYGMPVARTIKLDYHYNFMYQRHSHDQTMDREQDRLGWDTRPNTKPDLLAIGAELLRTESHGIKSRRLVGEMQTYIRNSVGKTLPEKGKFSDLLMAWLIAQFVARQLPVRAQKKGRPKNLGYVPKNPITGW